MGRMRKFLDKILKSKQGQTTTEYVLILLVVVMVVAKFKGLMKSQIEKAVGDLETKIVDIKNDN